MIYELFLEGELADIRQDLGMQLSFNIDDINKYGSRDTSFSKTIVLPGTARNNKLLGFIAELGSFNEYAAGSENINSNFNPAQTTKAELRANGLLLIKGVFRLTGIVKERDIIEYEGNLFGELGGFIAAIGNRRLQDLDFSAYDHVYSRDNIVNSWDSIDGSGYYYPLIDHGTYSTDKINYDYRTFRPALFAKEYLDKIFAASGYTYDASQINLALFEKLIIPATVKEAQGFFSDLFIVKNSQKMFLETTPSPLTKTYIYTGVEINRSFTGSGDPNITYTAASSANISISFNIDIFLERLNPLAYTATLKIVKNTTVLFSRSYGPGVSDRLFNATSFVLTSLNTNDTIKIELEYDNTSNDSYIKVNDFTIFSEIPILTAATLGNDLYMKDHIPQNIFQKDFFSWILKMFNVYVTEDKIVPNHLILTPYKDYYNFSDSIDWTYKVARDKPWQIKPMGMLNGRFFEYKYKDDNDYYNETYKKKYNLPYGSNLQDTGFKFAKDKQTIEIGFSPTVSVGYGTTDKIVPAIYKKTSGNSVDQEERIPHNIRILIAKKVTGVTSWKIVDKGSDFNSPGTQLGAALTSYGYAGHFNDPVNPTIDINFGASQEIYFDPNNYTSNNLFNVYWSGYIAEIADKDSKLLTCYVYLTELDIAQLDFSKPVFIDGVLWRINKVMDFDAASGELTKVELLKIIDTSYPCAKNWTKTNYTGTTFRNGDTIPQVTDPTAWANLTTPAWCYYDNDSANEATYGKLYNWYAINDPRGFAPDGYRVPTNEDWDSLVNCLGGSSVAGGKMKSTTGWDSPNTGATNESEFSGLPGGYREADGSFSNNIGEAGYWWSATEENTTLAWYRYLQYNAAFIDQEPITKVLGLSVRLIKI